MKKNIAVDIVRSRKNKIDIMKNNLKQHQNMKGLLNTR